MGEQLLKEISKKNWQLSGWNVESSLKSLKKNMHAMTDSRKPWPIMNVRKTDSNDCDYKYWVWRPFSAKPRCALLHGAECNPEDCPQKIKGWQQEASNDLERHWEKNS